MSSGYAQTWSIQSSCPPMRNDDTAPVSSSVPVLPLIGGGTGAVETATATPPIGVGAAASSPV